MRSVRARTTLVGMAVLTVAMVVGGAVLALTLDRVLIRDSDAVARAQAGNLAHLAAEGDLPQSLASLGDDTYAQIIDASGKVVAATPEVAGQPPYTFASAEPESVQTVDFPTSEGEIEHYRVWRTVQEGRNGRFEVVVGRDLEAVHGVVFSLGVILAVMLPLGVGAAGVVVWRLVGRALQPVEQIRAEVAEITQDRLAERVTVPEAHDEVSRLAVTMNELLDRIDLAYGRQRQFVADASHELQSPLTSFRTQLEVALAHPDRADWPETARTVLAESARMERIVTDLLFLAVADAAADSRPAGLVDFDEVVATEVGRPRWPAGVEVRLTATTAAPVRGRHEELSRMVGNLVDNAVHHANRRIELALQVTEATARLSVHDDGPGVPPELRERVFDRFWRAESARHRTGIGTGLGLPIARSIAERHGGTLVVDGDATGGCFVVTLPLAFSSASRSERVQLRPERADALEQ